jgi:hypothetical protein
MSSKFPFPHVRKVQNKWKTDDFFILILQHIFGTRIDFFHTHISFRISALIWHSHFFFAFKDTEDIVKTNVRRTLVSPCICSYLLWSIHHFFRTLQNLFIYLVCTNAMVYLTLFEALVSPLFFRDSEKGSVAETDRIASVVLRRH